jgi:SAM-dependent methyltransferase
MTVGAASPVCPMCAGTDLKVWLRASVDDLARLYRDGLAIDVRSRFGNSAELRLLKCAACDLGSFDPVVPGDGAFYEHLLRFEWYYPASKAEFGSAAKFVRNEDDVLEIGCGEGRFADHIRPRSFTGLEYTDRAVARARARGLRVTRESIESYSAVNAGSADVVCAFQVLEHVPAPRAFVEAALACLRPGGRLIVSVPSADGFMSATINNVLNFPPHHLTWWSDDALRALGARFGLALESLEHERLADEHVDGYVYALWIRGFDRPGRTANVIDRSMRVRLLSRTARIVAPVLRRALRNPALRPNGHTVTAVYRRA